MTVFNGSAFFERTLRGRFREKDIGADYLKQVVAANLYDLRNQLSVAICGESLQRNGDY